jgi:hypothetical protein
MHTVFVAMMVGCLSQAGYPTVDDRGTARAVYEQPGAANRSQELRWQRRDDRFSSADRYGSVRPASFDQSGPPVRPVVVSWDAWSLHDAESPAARLVEAGGRAAELEGLRGVPISLTEILKMSGGQTETVEHYWELVHRVTQLGVRRAEFDLMSQFGEQNKLTDDAWLASVARVEAEYLESKRDLLKSQERLRLLIGGTDVPVPSDPFWTGAYDTGLSGKIPSEVTPELRYASQQIELEHRIAQTWATTAETMARVNETQNQLDGWKNGFEAWRVARGKALQATADYNLAIARFALQVGGGDPRRLARMMIKPASEFARGFENNEAMNR